MIKNILVPVTGSASDEPALTMALRAAQLFSGRLHAVHFSPGPGQIVQAAAVGQFSSGLGTVELIKSLQKAAEEQARAARASFDAVGRSLPGGGDMGDYRDVEGDEVERVITEGRFHDLVVLGRAVKAGKYSPSEIGHILISVGRPILLAPAAARAEPTEKVVIAWKETAEAARAVTAAMPFLEKASRVFVLAGEEDESGTARQSAERLATLLEGHGIAAAAEPVALKGRSAADAVLERAGTLDAGLLVMGGYGHSRRREWVFGGFTRHVLQQSQMPVLLFH
jgi:nucleotide-binding universal stress UspA family protein